MLLKCWSVILQIPNKRQISKRLWIQTLICALLFATLVHADNENRDEPNPAKWWNELRKAAEACHNGRDIKVEVSGGLSARTLGNEARSGPFAEARITVPLYSTREREKGMQDKGKFLEHGAEILREFHEAQAKLRIKGEQAMVLKQAMLQEGLAGIEAFFKIQQEIASLQAITMTAEMKLVGFIESCGGAERVGTHWFNWTR